jgi:hypothetical protein
MHTRTCCVNGGQPQAAALPLLQHPELQLGHVVQHSQAQQARQQLRSWRRCGGCCCCCCGLRAARLLLLLLLLLPAVAADTATAKGFAVVAVQQGVERSQHLAWRVQQQQWLCLCAPVAVAARWQPLQLRRQLRVQHVAGPRQARRVAQQQALLALLWRGCAARVVCGGGIRLQAANAQQLSECSAAHKASEVASKHARKRRGGSCCARAGAKPRQQGVLVLLMVVAVGTTVLHGAAPRLALNDRLTRLTMRAEVLGAKAVVRVRGVVRCPPGAPGVSGGETAAHTHAHARSRWVVEARAPQHSSRPRTCVTRDGCAGSLRGARQAFCRSCRP